MAFFHNIIHTMKKAGNAFTKTIKDTAHRAKDYTSSVIKHGADVVKEIPDHVKKAAVSVGHAVERGVHEAGKTIGDFEGQVVSGVTGGVRKGLGPVMTPMLLLGGLAAATFVLSR